jgi:hypothetical protein
VIEFSKVFVNFDKHTEFDDAFEDIKASIKTALGNKRIP